MPTMPRTRATDPRWRARARVAELALIGLLTFCLAACGDGARLGRLATGERGRVVAVRSGAVLVLRSGLVVRLAGLAETAPDEPGAAQARAALQALVGGQAVSLFYDGARRDAQGEAVAQVRRDQGRLWIQGELIKRGWARVWPAASNRALASLMLAAEARARDQGRGLWAQAAWRVMLPDAVGPATHGFQIVEGRIASIHEGSAGAYLSFSAHPQGFAVLIPAEALAELRAAGFSPTQMAGRLVRVRGDIGWGGVMTVDHPQQIENLREP